MNKNNDNFKLNFISEIDFEKHVKETIDSYIKNLKPINLSKFKSNLVDPIKLLFDQSIYKSNYEKLIELEIIRQRDKSNNNAIGYFHQNIFKYINGCVVPEKGWDVIFTDSISETKYYVEIKNKFNTMNSSSSLKTFERFQEQLKKDPNSICVLVEVISKGSKNIPWIIEKSSHQLNEKIRKMSIDKFYEIVTKDKYSFKNMCLQLPNTINKIINNMDNLTLNDTVIKEIFLEKKSVFEFLLEMTFEGYDGFESINKPK